MTETNRFSWSNLMVTNAYRTFLTLRDMSTFLTNDTTSISFLVYQDSNLLTFSKMLFYAHLDNFRKIGIKFFGHIHEKDILVFVLKFFVIHGVDCKKSKQIIKMNYDWLIDANVYSNRMEKEREPRFPNHVVEVFDCAGVIPVNEEIFSLLKWQQWRKMWKKNDEVYYLLNTPQRTWFENEMRELVGIGKYQWISSRFNRNFIRGLYMRTSPIEANNFVFYPMNERMRKEIAMKKKFSVEIYC